MSLPPFDDQTLREICSVLGDTSRGLTNTEIAQVLLTCGIHEHRPQAPPGFYYAVSKKVRLYDALGPRQKEDGSGNIAARASS